MRSFGAVAITIAWLRGAGPALGAGVPVRTTSRVSGIELASACRRRMMPVPSEGLGLTLAVTPAGSWLNVNPMAPLDPPIRMMVIGNIRRRTPLDQRLTQRTYKKEIGLSAGCLLESNVAHGNSGQQCGIVDRLEHHRGDSRLGDGKIEGRVKTSPCRHVRDCRRDCHAASVKACQAQILLDSDPCNRQQANMQAYAALQRGKCDPRPAAAKLAAGRIVETCDMPARRVDHDSTNDPAIFQERYAQAADHRAGCPQAAP